jgi:nucleoside-diphosphate-sugar epimerase
MRLLVTGGSGFIGKAVERACIAAGHEFVTFDHPHDVCDFRGHGSMLVDVDGVINLAGILGTSETLNYATHSIAVNIVGAVEVAGECERLGIPLVQIGTGHRGQLNVYAVTKACAEDLILTRARWSGLKANVVRAFHAYGPGQKAPLPYGTATVRKIVPSFVCAALAGEPLVVNGTGMQQIDLIHVDDVATTLLDALQAPYGRTLEAGTGQAVTVLQAAHDVIAACNSRSVIQLVPMRPGEPIMSTVVATHPASVARAWPSLVDTIDYYQGVSA